MNVLRSIVRVLKAFTSSLNFILNVTVFLALILSLPVMWFWPFGRTHNPTVEVYDKAHILSSDTVAEKIQEIGFRQDVHVVVVSVPGYMIGNLNAEVLRYARTHQDAPRPWISSSNSNYWSDGIIILAVAPDSRKVGCYFGQDTRLPVSQQASIQSAAKKAFNDHKWDDGILAMAKKTADLLGRPAEGSWLTTFIIPAPASMIGIWALRNYLRRGLRARAVGKELTESYSRVSLGDEDVELNMRIIPENEPYGARVRMWYRWYCQEYASITRDLQAFGRPRGPQWFAWRMLKRVSRLKKRAVMLESLGATISNTASILNMSSTWEKAWEKEQGRVQEDLQALRSLCDTISASRDVPLGVKKERKWVKEQRSRLGDIEIALASGRMRPSDALDELERTAQSVRDKALDLMRRAVNADTSKYAEERRRRYFASLDSEHDVVRAGQWLFSSDDGGSNHSSSTYQFSGSPLGGDASSSGWEGAGWLGSFTSVSDLVVGYESAASYAPTTSGLSSYAGGDGSSGYSGSSSSVDYSGGDFSGAGSSSSF
ncbi:MULTISPECIES: DUF5129 domain-containing protein [Actinomyces]|uniref:DUF5129 domain-containing protein n=1 Tax=Actinomyces viscosus C505 TaxID=562973 RepID=F2UYF5_ACTVI|nr:DUF5129 domain-containing protein [Actinomyces oris]EGE38256.1 hypothetical protein HMPREF0059_01110 [Actinomyces viscosus C505]